MNRYALLSVSDKTNIVEVAQALVDQGIQLLSTGGTFKVIEEAGIPVQTVDSYTGFPEMMDGRVKTLHPKIHGGLLGLRDNEEHQQAAQTHEIAPIDFVIVNLYPFKETIQKENITLEDAIENIDIGGPSMLRSAAKNYRSVTVVTDPQDYPTLMNQLKESGETTFEFRAYLARKVYQLTSHYDTLIANYLMSQETETFPEAHAWNHITLTYLNEETLRYGENSHQTASFYREVNPAANTIAGAVQLHGKQLSYNNIKDADAAIKIALEFEEPVAVAVKHMNPCGVAIGETIESAFDRCYQADPVSIFGGIIVLNRPVSMSLAEKLHEIFVEIIIAPSFDPEAYELLASKKNIRLMTMDFQVENNVERSEFISVSGGLLRQDQDQSPELLSEVTDSIPDEWELMTEKTVSTKEIQALNFAMKVCKHVKSNAIVVTNECMTLGIGAGQMNRVGAAEIALKQAQANESANKETLVVASDAFFPFGDTVTMASQYGVTAIIQPGGSLKDQESVDVCNEKGIAMVKSHYRHFRH